LEMLRGRFGDRYKIIDSIGAGGVGHVYSALDRELKKKLALKVLVDGFGVRKDIQENFLKASEAGRKIKHPNIIPVYDVGRAGGYAFCAMELCTGKSLRTLLEEKHMISWEEAKPIFLQLCDALSALHGNSITHRNLKPSKVFISPAGDAILLDFAIAKVSEDDFSKRNIFVGTHSYAAPEQVLGMEEYDHRVDIYTLGLLMYYTLTGIHPFEDEKPTLIPVLGNEGGYGVYFTRPLCPQIAPRTLCASLSHPLQDVIMRAMEAEPDMRFQTASELRSAIEKL